MTYYTKEQLIAIHNELLEIKEYVAMTNPNSDDMVRLLRNRINKIESILN